MQLGFCDMAETITTAAINNGEDFPFVRVKLFEVPAKQTRELTGVEMFSWNPFVTEAQRQGWYNFTQAEMGWYEESKEIVINDSDTLLTATSYSPGTVRPYIWRSTAEPDGSTGNEEVPKGGPFAPIWQMSPPPFDPALLQYDMFGETYVESMLPVMFRTRDGLMSALDPTLSRLAGLAVNQTDHETFHSNCVTSVNGLSSYDHPHSVHLQPVFKKLQDPTSELVGFLALVVPWDCYLANLLPQGINGVYAVLKNTCGQAHTYILRGNRADYLGEGDMHNENYHDTEVIVPLTQYRFNETRYVEGHCVYSFYLYSSEEYESASETDLPVIFAVAVGVIFITMALTFLVYDRFVHRRNMKVVDAASKSNQILNTLFPQQVRDRLFANKSDDDANVGTKSKLTNMMNSGDFAAGPSSDDEVDDDIMYKTKPIADLFPETTILFADIAGKCNAEWWLKINPVSDDQSSSNLYLSCRFHGVEQCARTQSSLHFVGNTLSCLVSCCGLQIAGDECALSTIAVFPTTHTLLNLFFLCLPNSDEIARKRRVFKVETVGDCYVAVTGLPDPRKVSAGKREPALSNIRALTVSSPSKNSRTMCFPHFPGSRRRHGPFRP